MTLSKLNFYIIWGTTGITIFGIESLFGFYFNLWNYIPYLILLFATLPVWLSYRDIVINKQRNDITLKLNATINYNLSKKYTDVMKKLIHTDLEIFEFPALSIRYQSTAFTHFAKKPGIFIYEGLLKTLNDNEIEAVILHEIHHFIKKDGLKRYISGIAIIILIAISILAFVISIVSGSLLNFFTIVFEIAVLLCLFIFMIILKLNLVYSEISADTFAAKTMGTNIYVLSAIKKAFEISEQYFPDKKKRLDIVYQRRKSSLEKRKYLDVNESKASK